MAVFSVEISDADVVRVLDAVSANYNRPNQVPNPDYDLIANPDFDDSLPEDQETNPSMIGNGQDEYMDNPETKAQFANRKNLVCTGCANFVLSGLETRGTSYLATAMVTSRLRCMLPVQASLLELR